MDFALAQRLILATLLVLLPLLPPEIHGTSAAGCAALVAILALLARGAGSIRGGPAIVCLLATFAWPMVAASKAPGAAVTPLAITVLAVAAGLSAAALPAEVRRNALVPWSVVAGGTLAAGFGIYQKFLGFEHTLARIEGGAGFAHREEALTRLAEGRAFGPFATPAALGIFLGMTAAVTLGFAATARGRRRWSLAALAVVQLVGLAFTGSATAVAALLGAGALLAVRVPRSARSRGALLAGGTILLLVLAGIVAWRSAEILDPSHEGNPFRLRAGNFRIAVDMARDHPWIGVGPGGYGESYGRYRLHEDNESRHAHDLPLEAVAELGVPLGLVATVLFYWLFLAPLLRARRESDALRLGTSVALAAFALHNLADFTAFFPSLLWFAALLRGVSRDPSSDTADGVEPTTAGWTVPAVAAVVVTILAGVVAARGGLGRDALVEARDAQAGGDRARAVRLSARATELAPWNIDARLFRAWVLAETPGGPDERIHHVRQALEEAERAVDGSPVRASARAVRGRIREALGDLPGAYADFVAAGDLHPVSARGESAVGRVRRALAGTPREVVGD
jgi:hypothetical protein